MNYPPTLCCKAKLSFLEAWYKTMHWANRLCIIMLPYLCAVFMTRWTVRPSLMPCWLRLSPSFKIFPANIRTNWSCLALNRLEISSLNWKRATKKERWENNVTMRRKETGNERDDIKNKSWGVLLERVYIPLQHWDLKFYFPRKSSVLILLAGT